MENKIHKKITTQLNLLAALFLIIIFSFSGITFLKALRAESLFHPNDQEAEVEFPGAEAVHQEIDDIKTMSFWLIAISIIVLVGLVINIVMVINYSVKALLRGVLAFKAGDNDYEIQLRADNEFGQVAEVLNEAVANVKKINQELEAKNATLSKTNQKLKDKLEEIEKMNRLVVGREIKMVELKEELAKTKK